MTGVPDVVISGQAITATLVFKNSGTMTWQSVATNPATPYRLGSSGDVAIWGPARYDLPVPQVPPGATVTITVTATAPATPGVRLFSWGMLQESVQWFGQTATKSVIVRSP